MEQATFEQQLAWTKQNMTRSSRALAELPGLRGVRLACSMHLDLKMVLLVEGLLAKGAELYVVTCNPKTVRDRAVAEMRQLGALVEAWHDMPVAAYQSAIQQAVGWQPTHLCEMGADLSHELYRNDTLKNIKEGVQASLEATGSGINRLEGLDLTYPIFNWDDLPVKEGLHNRHMVGLTTWQTFFSCTHLTLHEKRVLVVGYGSVGQGIAAAARAYGGTVTIAEIDPVRQIEARYEGWQVLALEEAIDSADVIVTATGASDVISADLIGRLKHNVFLLNCGHRDTEIDTTALRNYPVQEPLPHVEAFQIGEKTIHLLARGSMFNLAAGVGDSLNAFDVTLAVMVAGIGHIVGEGVRQKPGVHILPRQVWERVI